jgi:hypothetical protein
MSNFTFVPRAATGAPMRDWGDKAWAERPAQVAERILRRLLRTFGHGFFWGDHRISPRPVSVAVRRRR